MKALRIGIFAGMLLVGTVRVVAAPSPPDATANTVATLPQRTPGTDGVRAEDIMIDDDAIGNIWDTTTPADAIGIDPTNTTVLPSVTSALSSAQLLREKEMLKPPRPATHLPKRTRTERWRPDLPLQTLFYLALAVIVVTVLLLKARG